MLYENGKCVFLQYDSRESLVAYLKSLALCFTSANSDSEGEFELTPAIVQIVHAETTTCTIKPTIENAQTSRAFSRIIVEAE